MCVFLRGEGEVSGSYKASGIPLKPLRITPGKGVVPVPGSLLPRMAPVDQHRFNDRIYLNRDSERRFGFFRSNQLVLLFNNHEKSILYTLSFFKLLIQSRTRIFWTWTTRYVFVANSYWAMNRFRSDLFLRVYPVISHKLTHKYREDQVQFSSIIRCVSLKGERGEYPDLIEPPEHPWNPSESPPAKGWCQCLDPPCLVWLLRTNRL